VSLPYAWGGPDFRGVISQSPDHFLVSEELGFEPSGEGEHAFLYLEKSLLNTAELVEKISSLFGVAQRDIGLCGLKDRNAITRQWLSIWLPGREDPDWSVLEQPSVQSPGRVKVIAVTRHRKKLRRGVHRCNRFQLRVSEVEGDRSTAESKLARIKKDGVPNYFGEQRFGRNGSTLEQAKQWIERPRRVTRSKRSLYFSALRSDLFNQLLAQRVLSESWGSCHAGDTCMLAGTRSHFYCEQLDESIVQRARDGDLHLALPLWGSVASEKEFASRAVYQECIASSHLMCDFLERSGPQLAWRSARVKPDDFSWRFCDDGCLELNFALGVGSYATTLLREVIKYRDGSRLGGSASE